LKTIFGISGHDRNSITFLFQKLPKVVQQTIAHVHPRGEKLQRPFYTPLHLELMATNDVTIHSVLRSPLPTMDITRRFLDEKYVDIPQGLHPLEVYMRVDRHTWLADHSLARSDRTSMIHGIEFRVPLLDLEVVAFADGVSAYKKSDPFVGKKIIRNTYRNHLPAHLYNQPKRGWLSPGAKWLRDPAIQKTVRAILSSEYYNGLDPLFDWKKVEELLDGHCSGGRYAFHPLWGILILQIWARQHKLKW
jgi:asparagine synthetase B (glutamine-hydrolysing)